MSGQCWINGPRPQSVAGPQRVGPQMARPQMAAWRAANGSSPEKTGFPVGNGQGAVKDEAPFRWGGDAMAERRGNVLGKQFLPLVLGAAPHGEVLK